MLYTYLYTTHTQYPTNNFVLYGFSYPYPSRKDFILSFKFYVLAPVFKRFFFSLCVGDLIKDMWMDAGMDMYRERVWLAVFIINQDRYIEGGGLLVL